MKTKKLKSISSHISHVIIIGLTCLMVMSFFVIILFGLVNEFNCKKNEAQQYANLIAQTASMPYGLGVELYRRQINDIKKNDGAVADIDFLEIQKDLSKNDGQSSIWTVFIENRYSAHKNVVEDVSMSNQVIEQLMGLQMPSQSFDNNLVGFVSVTIDLKFLREQWFANNFWFLLSLAGLQVLVLVIVVRIVIKTNQESFELLNTSNLIIESDDISGLPILREDVKFIEIFRTRQAFNKLIEKNHAITDALQQLKIDAEKNRALDERLTRQLNQLQHLIDYEFKSSLNSIVGGVQLLSQQYLTEEQNDALTVVRRGGQLLDFILKQISQLNAIEKGQVKINQVEFNPLQLVSDVVAEYQVMTDKKQLDLVSAISHMDYTLLGDADKIRNIFQIIMDNAVKYTESGSITISSNLQHFDNSTRWTIAIKDTGIGIPEQYHEDVFAPFFQVDNAINDEYNGVGVGLTLAKQLAEVLGASLTLESTPEVGTVVELIVPLHEKSQMFEKELLTKKNIACVYGSENIHSDLNQLLDFGAKSVRFYQNVNEILEVLHERHIDVLIISSNVKDGMVAKLVKEYRYAEKNHRSLIIRLYPDNEQTIDEALMEAVGIDLAIRSPYILKEVAMTINEWLQ